MFPFSSSLRLLLLAATLSSTLTSCFGDKKKNPQPQEGSACVAPKDWCGTPSPAK